MSPRRATEQAPNAHENLTGFVLFVGAVETFVPYGGTPSGRYEIKPIGYLSLGIPPDGYVSEADYEIALMQLRLDQARSRELWPYYKWLAQIEELFH